MKCPCGKECLKILEHDSAGYWWAVYHCESHGVVFKEKEKK